MKIYKYERPKYAGLRTMCGVLAWRVNEVECTRSTAHFLRSAAHLPWQLQNRVIVCIHCEADHLSSFTEYWSWIRSRWAYKSKGTKQRKRGQHQREVGKVYEVRLVNSYQVHYIGVRGCDSIAVTECRRTSLENYLCEIICSFVVITLVHFSTLSNWIMKFMKFMLNDMCFVITIME